MKVELNMPDQAKNEAVEKGIFRIQEKIINEEGQEIDNPKSEAQQISEDIENIVKKELNRRARRQARQQLEIEDFDLSIEIKN